MVFQFGDHGLIDKTHRLTKPVPKYPCWSSRRAKFQRAFRSMVLVGNIDIAPTLLEAANASAPKNMNGQSVWKALCASDASSLNDRTLLYEYYWERNYPHTPTLHAIIGGRFKYIRCHGLWDRDELYDLESDPGEMQNLIHDSRYADRIESLNQQLWQLLKIQHRHGDAIAGRSWPTVSTSRQEPISPGRVSERILLGKVTS
ncbi:sulfatase/phosphatase domain-containing protein, partial [Rhodopirellula europaea]|uniref:sulfatase/phosphatase domain-containing protein n=1 Tax=Rhodopirellula europaea TaxID=1263866 RepID=UPI003D28135D